MKEVDKIGTHNDFKLFFNHNSYIKNNFEYLHKGKIHYVQLL